MRLFRPVLGMLLLTIGLPALLAGGCLWAALRHRDAGGAFSAELQRLSVPGYAIVVPDVDRLLRDDASFARVGGTELRITALTDEGPAFVGLAPAGEVESYLRGVPHTEVRGVQVGTGELPITSARFDGDRSLPSAPGHQDFWTRTGGGALRWTPGDLTGGYSLVIMNATGGEGLRLNGTVEVRPGWLDPTAWGLLSLGAMLAMAGVIVLAMPGRRREVVYVVEPSQVPELMLAIGAPLPRLGLESGARRALPGADPSGFDAFDQNVVRTLGRRGPGGLFGFGQGGAHRPRTLADTQPARPPALPQFAWPPKNPGGPDRASLPPSSGTPTAPPTPSSEPVPSALATAGHVPGTAAASTMSGGAAAGAMSGAAVAGTMPGTAAAGGMTGAALTGHLPGAADPGHLVGTTHAGIAPGGITPVVPGALPIPATAGLAGATSTPGAGAETPAPGRPLSLLGATPAMDEVSGPPVGARPDLSGSASRMRSDLSNAVSGASPDLARPVSGPRSDLSSPASGPRADLSSPAPGSRAERHLRRRLPAPTDLPEFQATAVGAWVAQTAPERARQTEAQAAAALAEAARHRAAKPAEQPAASTAAGLAAEAAGNRAAELAEQPAASTAAGSDVAVADRAGSERAAGLAAEPAFAAADGKAVDKAGRQGPEAGPARSAEKPGSAGEEPRHRKKRDGDRRGGVWPAPAPRRVALLTGPAATDWAATGLTRMGGSRPSPKPNSPNAEAQSASPAQPKAPAAPDAPVLAGPAGTQRQAPPTSAAQGAARVAAASGAAKVAAAQGIAKTALAETGGTPSPQGPVRQRAAEPESTTTTVAEQSEAAATESSENKPEWPPVGEPSRPATEDAEPGTTTDDTNPAEPATEDLAAAGSVAGEAAVGEPVTGDLAAAGPVAGEAAVGEPVTGDLAAAGSVAGEAPADEPVTVDLAAAGSVAGEAAVGESVTGDLAVAGEAAVAEPVTEDPAVAALATGDAAADGLGGERRDKGKLGERLGTEKLPDPSADGSVSEGAAEVNGSAPETETREESKPPIVPFPTRQPGGPAAPVPTARTAESAIAASAASASAGSASAGSGPATAGPEAGESVGVVKPAANVDANLGARKVGEEGRVSIHAVEAGPVGEVAVGGADGRTEESAETDDLPGGEQVAATPKAAAMAGPTRALMPRQPSERAAEERSSIHAVEAAPIADQRAGTEPTQPADTKTAAEPRADVKAVAEQRADVEAAAEQRADVKAAAEQQGEGTPATEQRVEAEALAERQVTADRVPEQQVKAAKSAKPAVKRAAEPDRPLSRAKDRLTGAGRQSSATGGRKVPAAWIKAAETIAARAATRTEPTPPAAPARPAPAAQSQAEANPAQAVSAPAEAASVMPARAMSAPTQASATPSQATPAPAEAPGGASGQVASGSEAGVTPGAEAGEGSAARKPRPRTRTPRATAAKPAATEKTEAAESGKRTPSYREEAAELLAGGTERKRRTTRTPARNRPKDQTDES
ncbi:hypothetical protein GCM10010168_15090 [Actinoplanes ianthinogenes]|uniref:Uncharacterized protein n=1 Tax=Actinoplanes ianthinogenes TaxID=122358 RepID=A0ABN6CJC2_9ACTN|nr:hypothetical protein [Actinoplanes ianthinogenes]BCJ44696.1 hypothetical protein Aiant_53530 [Actinoplanes ianthinogenes]GGQ99448.1 hypothetical protein GCM10010168_15090 [Actinoplanes ianthinogenes]